MPAASLIDSYLPAPFNRKVDFHAAFKAAVEAAGFPTTDIDVFDTADSELVANYGSTYFAANTVGSIKGFVKEIVFNGSSKGTVQIVFFTRTIRASTYGGYGATVPFLDIVFVPGCYVIQGGWNSTTKLPNVLTSTIGGYACDSAPDATFNSFWGTGNSKGTLGTPNANTGRAGDIPKNILNYTNPIKLTAINHPEIRGVYIQQAEKYPMFFGLCRPVNKPLAWNENIYPYCYVSENSSFFRYRSFYGSQNPYNCPIDNPTLLNFPGCTAWVYEYTQQGYTEPGFARGSDISTVPINPINPANNNKRDIITAPYLINNSAGAGVESGRWLVGQFSDDIVIAPSVGLDFRDKMIVSPGTEEYTVITTPEVGNYTNQSSMSYRKVGDVSFFSFYVLGLRTT